MLRSFVLSLAVATLALGSISPACASDDTSKVNGSIRIEDGKTVGDLDTVNGSINLGAHGQADEVSTVNGSIDIGDDASIRSAGTVNGRIALGKRVRVSAGIDTDKPVHVLIGPRAVVKGTLVFERNVELLVSDSAQIGEVTGAKAVRFSGDQP